MLSEAGDPGVQESQIGDLSIEIEITTNEDGTFDLTLSVDDGQVTVEALGDVE